MKIQEYKHLRAEQTALQRMLASIPEENVLDRSGLEARLDEVAEQLGAAGTPSRGPARRVRMMSWPTPLPPPIRELLPRCAISSSCWLPMKPSAPWSTTSGSLVFAMWARCAGQ